LDAGQSIIYQKLLSLPPFRLLLAVVAAAAAAAAAAFAAHFARETEE